MDVLVLGGTWFLGREVVSVLVAGGHRVSTFNRGRTDRDVDGVRAIRGDRRSRSDLMRAAVMGPYDVVIDPSGYVPADARLVVDVFGEAAGHLLFVSSVDAYDGWPDGPVTESSPLHAVPHDLDSAPYGHRKAACEELLSAEWPGALGIVRPGVILGPREPKGRLPWWLRRVARGGPMIAPGDPNRRMQPIDVADAADFIVRLVEHRWSGSVNLASDPGHTTMGEMLDICMRVVGGVPDFHWMSDEALGAAGVREWTELPMWRSAPGTWEMDVRRAFGLGLRVRSMEETVARTWEWVRSGQQVADHWRTAAHGIDPSKERELLFKG